MHVLQCRECNSRCGGAGKSQPWSCVSCRAEGGHHWKRGLRQVYHGMHLHTTQPSHASMHMLVRCYMLFASCCVSQHILLMVLDMSVCAWLFLELCLASNGGHYALQVGVLTRHILDDGRGFARSKVFKHGHEEATGRTSSIGQHNLCVSSTSCLPGCLSHTVASALLITPREAVCSLLCCLVLLGCHVLGVYVDV